MGGVDFPYYWLGQNRVAYNKFASYVAWKCLTNLLWVVVDWAPIHYVNMGLLPIGVEVKLGCDKMAMKYIHHYVVLEEYLFIC